MIQQDLYDELSRVLTDYEGYGTDDEDVKGNIQYVVETLNTIAMKSEINPFVERTILRTIDKNNPVINDDDIYDLGCRVQVTWNWIWNYMQH